MIVETLDLFGMLPKSPCLPTQEQEIFLNWCCVDWTMDAMTGIVDVNGTFNCAETKTTDFCGLVFGTVGGDFNCRHNPLRSLSGSPRIVKGDFDCRHVELQDLQGSPLEIGGRLYVTESSVRSYFGAPPKIDGGIWADKFRVAWDFVEWLAILRRLDGQYVSSYLFMHPHIRRMIYSLTEPESIADMVRRDEQHMLGMVAEVWRSPDFDVLRHCVKFPDHWNDELFSVLLREKEIQGFF